MFKVVSKRLRLAAPLLGFFFLTACGGTDKVENVSELKAWLGLSSRAGINTLDFAKKSLSKEEIEQAKATIYSHNASEIEKTFSQQWDAREISLGELKMPFFYKIWGDKPEGGRSLWISMHGGGGAPAKVNDQQFENQKRLYNKTMQGLEGVYMAVRAPRNTWDLWHQTEIEEFFNVLIKMAVIKEGVNPDKVYVLGYSAGGDGVYRMAPRMADRWAAASMMAGHPGGSSPLSLRNLPFSLHMGELDGAYDRNKIAAEWGVKFKELKDADPEGYDHFVKIHKGKGHWMELQDAAALPWMYKFTRKPFASKLVWHIENNRLPQFYWLEAKKSDLKPGEVIRISYDKASNSVNVEENPLTTLQVNLNDEMLDLSKEVTVNYQGKSIFKGKVNRNIANLWTSMKYKNDVKLAFPAGLIIKANSSVEVK